MRHHRAHRRRRREDVGRLMAREEVQLLVRVEPALALIDELHRAEAPRPEQRRDARGPRPLAHAVEALAVAHVVAVDELLVREQVPVRVDDALRQPGRARRVVELRRVLGERVHALEGRVAGGQQLVVEHRGCARRATGRHGPGWPRWSRAPWPASRSRGGGCRRRRTAPTSTAGSRPTCRCRRTRPRSRASAAAASPPGRPWRPRARAARWRSGSRAPAARPTCTSRTVPSKCSWIIASLSAGCLSQTSCAML